MNLVDSGCRVSLCQNSGSPGTWATPPIRRTCPAVLPCPVPFQTSFVGWLLDVYQRFTNGSMSCFNGAIAGTSGTDNVKSVESDQVWPSSRAIDNHAGTVHVPPSMYLPKAAWFPLSPKTKELCTIIYWYVTNKLQTICSFNLAVSDQVLQRLEDAKQKTRGQCSILKELASYSTTAFGLCYTDLNMSATSRQLDIWSKI